MRFTGKFGTKTCLLVLNPLKQGACRTHRLSLQKSELVFTNLGILQHPGAEELRCLKEGRINGAKKKLKRFEDKIQPPRRKVPFVLNFYLRLFRSAITHPIIIFRNVFSRLKILFTWFLHLQLKYPISR